jgi:myo-inositol-1(or 4)-monophosphatase
MINLESICEAVAKLAAETGEFIRNESGVFDISKAETKGLHDYVSYVDKESEKRLVEGLSNILPEAGFIAEEGTSSKTGIEYNWVIDPLDGTTNFLHGLSPFAISIGLEKNNRPVLGVVQEIMGRNTFSAWENGGARLNGAPVRVSKASTLAASLVATGFPYNDFSRLANYMESLTWFCRNTQGIRRLGSASIDLCYIACGKFESFYEYDLKRWDISAGIIILREAGGVVSDFSGNENNLSGSEIVAANKSVYPEFLKIVSNFMKD